MTRARSAGLARDEGGAIVVFGVFFAVLVLGMLYYLVGIAATIYLRERMQDAADASAFASAVVHARGMNTLALINMIMAAILSVLVTLRLIEALIIIAEVILYALSWLGGATAAVASALEVLRQEVNTIAEEAEPIIQNVLKVLHVAGNVVKVITPIGANLSVLGKVTNQYDPEVELGVAIPPRFTLPVEDDEYKYLCEKAGAMAGTLVMLPLSPILPSFVEDGLVGAISKLTGAGSGWFCGDENSSAPDYDVEPQNREYPRSDEFNDCLNRDKKSQNSIEKCKEAEEKEARAEPNKDTGECRKGDDVCSVEKDTDENGVEVDFQFSDKSYCGSTGQGAKVSSADCNTVKGPDGKQYPDPNTPYGERLLKGREQCTPDGKKTGYWWTERELQVTWQRDPKTGEWAEVGKPVEVSQSNKHEADDSKRMPCEEPQTAWTREVYGGASAPQPPWNTGDLTKPVCQLDEPKPTLPGVNQVTLARREVTQVLGCKMKEPAGKTVNVKPLNVGADAMQQGTGVGSGQEGTTGGDFKGVDMGGIPSGFGGSGGAGMSSGGASGGASGATGGASGATGGSAGNTGETGAGGASGGSQGNDNSNMNPFRFEKDHKLGFSDMQIRSLVFGRALDDTKLNKGKSGPNEGETAHSHAKRTVELSKWQVGDADVLTGLTTASELWGRIAVAQAEYFFDVSQPEDEKFAKWHREGGERDYLWYMGWTARMRRFRLSWEVDGKSADGEREGGKDRKKEQDNNKLISAIGGSVFKGTDMTDMKSPDELSKSGPEVSCLGIAICDQLKGQMTSFDTLFLH